MYICICNAVTERDIDRCVRGRADCSLDDLQQELGVAAGCGCCRESAAAVLAESVAASSPAHCQRGQRDSRRDPPPLLEAA